MSLFLLFGIALAKVGTIEAEDAKHPLKENRFWPISQEEKLKDHLIGIPAGISGVISEFESHSPHLTLGNEKGDLIEKIISVLLSGIPASEPIHVLELGSHLGDGSLRILRALGPREGTLVSTEPSVHMHSIGNQIVRHALNNEPTNRLTYMNMMHPHDFDDWVSALGETHEIPSFHVVFMDHGDHTTFAEDLGSLIGNGMLAPGAKIIADNALTKKEEKSDYFDAIKDMGLKEEIHEIGLPYKDRVHVVTWEKPYADEL